jgi:hypothetical protein
MEGGRVNAYQNIVIPLDRRLVDFPEFEDIR